MHLPLLSFYTFQGRNFLLLKRWLLSIPKGLCRSKAHQQPFRSPASRLSEGAPSFCVLDQTFNVRDGSLAFNSLGLKALSLSNIKASDSDRFDVECQPRAKRKIRGRKWASPKPQPLRLLIES